VVRRRSAKPLFTGSNPVAASIKFKKKGLGDSACPLFYFSEGKETRRRNISGAAGLSLRRTWLSAPRFEKGEPGWIHAELGMNCFVKGNGKELGDGATFYFLDTKFQFKAIACPIQHRRT
jgi:hypothetical protein